MSDSYFLCAIKIITVSIFSHAHLSQGVVQTQDFVAPVCHRTRRRRQGLEPRYHLQGKKEEMGSWSIVLLAGISKIEMCGRVHHIHLFQLS